MTRTDDASLARLQVAIRLAAEDPILLVAEGWHEASLERLRRVLDELGPYEALHLGREDALRPGRRRRLLYGLPEIEEAADRREVLAGLNQRRDRLRKRGLQVVLFIEGPLWQEASEQLTDFLDCVSESIEVPSPVVRRVVIRGHPFSDVGARIVRRVNRRRAWHRGVHIELLPDSSDPHERLSYPSKEELAARLEGDLADMLSQGRRERQEDVVSLPPVRPTGEGEAPPRGRVVTGERIIGRESEITELDELFEEDNAHVVAICGLGGIGKTALVQQWVGRLVGTRRLAGRRCFNWYYSLLPSTDQFLQQALEWAGDPGPGRGATWERGQRLAARLRRNGPWLLFLDGLEHAQHKAGPQPGRLTDPGLLALLVELQRAMDGLCVVTSRLEIHGVRRTEPIVLRPLSAKAGAELLRAQGVEGSEGELQATAEDFGGHPLALILLGAFVREALEGEVRRRSELPKSPMSRSEGGHARRVLAGFEALYRGRPELEVLELLALFDGPTPRAALDRLVETPGLDLDRTIASLRGARLLAPEDPKRPGDIDLSNPVIRDHFDEAQQRGAPGSRRARHGRAYSHCRELAGSEAPSTVAGLQPLAAAVRHGCLGGRAEEALDKVFWPLVRRGPAHHSIYTLGAVSTDFACLLHFFEAGSWQPISGLSKRACVFLLGEAAAALERLGQVREALEPSRRAWTLAIEQQEWLLATQYALNLAHEYAVSGRIADGREVARQAIQTADRTGQPRERANARALRAHTHALLGEGNRADALFREAEELPGVAG